MYESKGMWEGLTDLSFRRYATPGMLRFLYALHLIMGLVAAVTWIVLTFQQSPVQGLLALVIALTGFFLWVLYCRVAVEVLAAVFRIADGIAADRGNVHQFGRANPLGDGRFSTETRKIRPEDELELAG